MSKPATIAVETLGCKLNQYESESIATELTHRGYHVVPFDAATHADAYVINTCTVTSKADRKTRNLVNRAIRSRPAGSGVIVTGCFVDGNPTMASEDEATYFVDNRHKHAIPEILEAHLHGEIVAPESFPADIFGFVTPERVFHTRTTIKIQDGCDNFCTFCIIPFVRGRAQSRAPQQVLDEARAAIAGGARELILTGVNMSRYRAETSDTNLSFTTLVGAILDLPGEFRLRISSLEPDGLTPEFAELFRHPKLTPHLHLCMQSASPRVLLAMRRMYTYAEYEKTVRLLREIDPSFNITTDMIVGFPGETPEEHASGLTAIAELGFGHVHTFPYSRRSGTRADRMTNHVDERTKRQRAEEIRRSAEESKRRYRAGFLGRTQTLLVERIDTTGTWAEGLGEHYIPIRASLPSGADISPNQMYSVTITGIEDGEDPRLTASFVRHDG